MKITISTRQFLPPFKGGVDVYADRLGQALKRQGHQVSYLAFDLLEGKTDKTIVVSKDEYDGSGIWRFRLTSLEHHDSTFQIGYDRAMGEQISRSLSEIQPNILIILNFYIATMAAVEAAARLGIPVAHIATDFIPVCRRATLIQWDGKSCETGESVKACSACFISQRRVGRYLSGVMALLPQDRLINLAHQEAEAGSRNPLHRFHPYFKQIVLMENRIKTLTPLRDQIKQVFAPTQFTARAFIDNGFAPENVSVLPFAVEHNSPLSKIKHRKADHIRFLFVGRLQPYKGVHILIEAFNRISDLRGATLDIYGVPDGYDNYYQSLQQQMEENERIRFRGRIDPRELPSAFSEADYFVLPSIWHENSPLILLDSLQSRTPVIASNIGGVSDLIVDGQNGFLFPMGDTNALQDIFEKVIENPSIHDKLRPARDLPSIEEYAAQVMAQSIPSVTAMESSQTAP